MREHLVYPILLTRFMTRSKNGLVQTTRREVPFMEPLNDYMPSIHVIMDNDIV